MRPMLIFFSGPPENASKRLYFFYQLVFLRNSVFPSLPEPDYPLEVAAQGERPRCGGPINTIGERVLITESLNSNPKLYLVVTPRLFRNYFLVLSVS